MIRSLKRFIILILIVTFLGIFLFGNVEAFSLGFSPLNLLRKAANAITTRASDIVTYLIMQKRYLFDNYVDPNSNISTLVLNSTSTATLSGIQNIIPVTKSVVVVPTVSSAPPLIVESNTQNYFVLSDSDNLQILKYTNSERANSSILPLTSNSVLDDIASLRADDLFNYQYFEHESPDGKTASALAKQIGYDYLLIGENLALGTFGSDKGIVDAWMASPGHKANILNSKYQQLGVAVKDGMYKGEKMTMAVQIFALPLSNCPKPNYAIKTIIDNSSASIINMQKEAKILYDNLTNLKNTPGVDRSYYNQKIQEYNLYAKQINDAVLNIKIVIDSYNIEVSNYNSCIHNL